MENKKNDFDDIILEKSNKSEKIKKILLRIIALVILFLVVMIVMKLLNGSEETVNDTILPSEPVASENLQENGFENMPITQNSPEDQFELLRKQIQGEENNTQALENNANEAQFTMPPVEDNVSNEPIKSSVKESEPNVFKEQVAEKPVEKVNVKKESKKEEPKKEPVKAKNTNTDAKELFKSVDTKTLHPSGLETGVYVQIFSVSNLDQKSKELAAVKQKGYTYKLYKTVVNGKEITKVLIGPFDKNTIANELAKIRKDIGKDAFSFTLK